MVDGKAVSVDLISDATISDILCPLVVWLHGLTSTAHEGKMVLLDVDKRAGWVAKGGGKGGGN